MVGGFFSQSHHLLSLSRHRLAPGPKEGLKIRRGGGGGGGSESNVVRIMCPPGKCFTSVTKTIANLATYSR